MDYEKWYKKIIEKSNESEQHLLNLTTLELIEMIQELKDENERLKSELEAIHSHASCVVTQASRALKIGDYAE